MNSDPPPKALLVLSIIGETENRRKQAPLQ
jgi:hypothetical protein